MPQELNDMQEVALTGFDKYGLSATLQFTSEDYPSGGMTTYLVRGMVSVLVKVAFFSVVRGAICRQVECLFLLRAYIV